MARWTGVPAYLQIASDYRAKILSGELPGDAKLPSETELTREFGVSRIVAKMAINTLRAEGLVYSHQGKGTFVKTVRRTVRDSSSRYSRSTSDSSPFRSDAEKSGQAGTWEHDSARTTASDEIAIRLHIEPGDPVMRTNYRFLANGQPLQISESYEPLALTGGTPIELPEEGPATGVIARMDAIGVRVDSVEERVTARAAHPDEIIRLALATQGAYVLVIERTHYADGQPIETCNIVFPGDRYELTYRLPVT